MSIKTRPIIGNYNNLFNGGKTKHIGIPGSGHYNGPPEGNMLKVFEDQDHTIMTLKVDGYNSMLIKDDSTDTTRWLYCYRQDNYKGTDSFALPAGKQPAIYTSSHKSHNYTYVALPPDKVDASKKEKKKIKAIYECIDIGVREGIFPHSSDNEVDFIPIETCGRKVQMNMDFAEHDFVLVPIGTTQIEFERNWDIVHELAKKYSIEGVVIEDRNPERESVGTRYKLRFDMFPDSKFKQAHHPKLVKTCSSTDIKPIMVTPDGVINMPETDKWITL